MRISPCGSLAVVFVLLAGCATIPPPRTEIARAELAVEQAITNDANRYAPVSLREANNKLDQARLAYTNQDYTRSNHLAQEALVSAQLALAQTQTERAQALVDENLRSLATLREELNRESTR